jgi:hypothetical protein
MDATPFSPPRVLAAIEARRALEAEDEELADRQAAAAVEVA